MMAALNLALLLNLALALAWWFISRGPRITKPNSSTCALTLTLALALTLALTRDPSPNP